MELNKDPMFKVLMRTEVGFSEYIIDMWEIPKYLKNKRVISIDMINDNLPKMKNPPPPPPKKVIIQPPPQAKVKGLEVDANDYFRCYMKQKFQEEKLPIDRTIIGLLIVLILLVLYVIIKIS